MTGFRRFAADAARLGFSPRDALRTAVALDAGFNEADHPREGGKFTSGVGGGDPNKERQKRYRKGGDLEGGISGVAKKHGYHEMDNGSHKRTVGSSEHLLTPYNGTWNHATNTPTKGWEKNGHGNGARTLHEFLTKLHG